MDLDPAEMVNEVKEKVILHWNCRGLTELPEIIRKYGNHIQEIYLKWNKLTTLPPWIIELFNVTNLYIYGNLIKELPVELGNMSQLTVLDLSANKLKEIPSSIGNLINIESLLFNDNYIKKLPMGKYMFRTFSKCELIIYFLIIQSALPSIYKTEMSQLHNLEVLSLSGNEFVALPEWLGSLPKLKELNADNNYLKELPNRLTLAPKVSVISVCSNRLKYLPLNGFLSSPCIRFDANEYLNYLSYPVLIQLAYQIHTSVTGDSVNILGYKCFKLKYDDNQSLNTNIKLNIKIDASCNKNIVIELPRQILRIHNVNENKTVSLWELALRKVYRLKYKHILNISTSPINVKVVYKQNTKRNFDFLMSSINCASYNLLINGPATICVNSHCQQPIFTEAWIIVGIIHHIYSIPTIALCCSRSCAFKFMANSSMMLNFRWYCIN
uniref:leucine-rich repeat and death domain-containing protein 1-like isoform X1 n=1 Tax=Vespula vulgaris TaxID=7454 RepID=UPI00223B3A3A|nr:leucine-rich repeat and death domain-containing protein 1-like isoform X1 [Vespula vulgaris]XP_050859814.1 leucine-rich repeat and death domain-containing protein 1-like isoform X1 [Vespula vulgaris]XP_050859815.1 leucine-rich repeat and death domain-containing protein 1-like isoform X1 [Vespula vulgaris]XP_050859817.1 leucine-rich repeat and death domain-containing protein 1-like isoform X1 [Vespula vulgaris]